MSMISNLVGRMEDLLMELKKMYENGWDYGDEIKTVGEAITTIKDLSAKLSAANMERSSQYYNGGWIPASERLPHDREWYLVACEEPGTGFIGVPFIGDYLNGKHTKFTTDDGWILRGFTDWDDTPIYDYYKKLKVVAYSPLPKPYKLKETEDN